MASGRLQGKTILITAALLDSTEADGDLRFDLDVKSMFYMTRVFMLALLEKSKSTGCRDSISNMASSIKGFANRCAYGATKALIGLTGRWRRTT